MLGTSDFFPRIVALQRSSVCPHTPNQSAIVQILALWAVTCTFLFAGELAAQLFQLALPDKLGPAARLPAVPLLCASACEPVLQPACSFVQVHGASPPPARAHCQITNWLGAWLAMMSVSVSAVHAARAHTTCGVCRFVCASAHTARSDTTV